MAVAKLSWTVKEYSKLPKDGNFEIESPEFHGQVQDGIQTVWKLRLYPNGDEDEDADYIALYLDLFRSNRTAIVTKFKLWFTDTSNILFCQHFCGGKENFNYMKPPSSIGWEKYCLTKFLNDNNLLEGDQLRIHCEVYEIESAGKPLNVNVSAHVCALANRFRTMYEQQKHTDVTILVGQKEFRVHKIVLATKTKVFEAMFEHTLAETINNCVEIVDFDADTIEKLIKFIYTGECGNLEEGAAELLACAEKYDVEELKCECEVVLVRSLNPENASDALRLADVHRAELLKEYALSFIEDNLEKVMPTEGYKMLPRSLVDELLMKIYNTLQKLA